MGRLFEPIAHGWVARQANPIGVIEFLGGACYGIAPNVFYRYFLQSLYKAGYTVFVIPFIFGFNHGAIACNLLRERDAIRAELGCTPSVPHFWVGHSVGCKYIALLEAYGAILDQPSLLLAPDISDTRDAVPLSIVADWLEARNLGVRPNRADTQALIQASNLFNLTAIVSFAADDIAGKKGDAIAQSDVAWFVDELQSRQNHHLLHEEIAGSHLEPVGMRLGDYLLRPSLRESKLDLIQTRELETVAGKLLAQLATRLKAIKEPAKPVPAINPPITFGWI
jgi:hypothetical protein